jgi:two-component system, LytTR family, response regulator
MPVELIEGDGETKLNLPTSTNTIKEPLRDVVRFEADSNYSKVIFANRPPVFVARTLGVFEKLLSGLPFFRVHHKHLVNQSHIKKYDKTENHLECSDGTNVPVSRRKRESFLENFDEN